MSEPAPNDARPADESDAAGDRDARVEQLLLAGLDHYFGGRYEHAVHVWTRVLFLDRGHARARAYIERARSALAERQRQSEELLHRGTAAFEHGQVGAARRLLTEAVAQGVGDDVALAYLGRLDRLAGDAESGRAPASPADSASMAPATPPVSPSRRARRWLAWSAAAVVVIVAGLVVAGAVRELDGWVPPAGRESGVSLPADPIPLVRASEVALARARSLFDTGHAADAVRLLGTIPSGDPNRAEADRLLADIQRALLAAAEPTPGAGGGPLR
jgi:hypothetical protein